MKLFLIIGLIVMNTLLISAWCFIGIGTTCEGEDEVHKIYDINNVEYEFCMGDENLKNEDGYLVEDEEERLEICFPLEKETLMITETETEDFITRTTLTPSCKWYGTNGIANDFMNCTQEVELISKKDTIMLEKIEFQGSEEIKGSMSTYLDYVSVVKDKPNKIIYKFNPSAILRKEAYNIKFEYGGKNYTLE